MQTEQLGDDAIPAIAALGKRALIDPPSLTDLRRALTAPDQPAVVRGDPDRGVVASVTGPGGGFVRFVAVDPAHRGQGLGRALLGAAETDLRDHGATTVTIGADAPHYLWAGIDGRELSMVCLAERMRYARVETNFNMDVDLRRHLPEAGASPGLTIESWLPTGRNSTGRGGASKWCARATRVGSSSPTITTASPRCVHTTSRARDWSVRWPFVRI